MEEIKVVSLLLKGVKINLMSFVMDLIRKELVIFNQLLRALV
jgi:hypothetical protein